MIKDTYKKADYPNSRPAWKNDSCINNHSHHPVNFGYVMFGNYDNSYKANCLFNGLKLLGKDVKIIKNIVYIKNF